ncbi:GNAT family N-acetyltransferase [Streptomyces sp. MP131-18]|uniref:GNAT family N-acetyltransferase n=1 Tax=Streptomyces sp. MP131-18 TaxID=1857892 RepID=UPI00097C3364|nr:GNAT family N-acetyltransferase [Streptomyces sp. MP131-18]ONK12837.1 aminoalkylphosphonic acid N-acetyltransferase [Streptomyces sp. MP131-18]
MNITMRRATADDIPHIVAMLADDVLGAGREDPADLTPYLAAFARIDADPHQHLLVAERDQDGRVVGTLQLSILHGLSRKGSSRALIESVRVAAEARGTGLGSELIRRAVEEAGRQGCALVQLTSDATRTDAHRFYEKLGFRPTHVGFKLPL